VGSNNIHARAVKDIVYGCYPARNSSAVRLFGYPNSFVCRSAPLCSMDIEVLIGTFIFGQARAPITASSACWDLIPFPFGASVRKRRRFERIRAGPPGGRPAISSRSGSSARHAVERAIYSGGSRGAAAVAAAALKAAAEAAVAGGGGGPPGIAYR